MAAALMATACLASLPASEALADPSCDDVNSENIGDHLSPAPSHPLVGFWKNDCEDGFGLAIDRAREDLYSIFFCGPGGCFAPGTYRPDSPIVGDPDYRVIDSDTLDVRTPNGFLTYLRCTPRPRQPAS